MKRIIPYLGLAYRRDVLKQPVNPESALEYDAEYKAELETELARINELASHVGNLAQRDFASYQNRRAIEAALARLKESDNAVG